MAGIRCCNAFALLSPGGSANPGLIVATVGAYSENGPVGADIDPRRSLHGRASIVDRSSLSRRPKKRGPFHFVPVMAKATLDKLS